MLRLRTNVQAIMDDMNKCGQLPRPEIYCDRQMLQKLGLSGDEYCTQTVEEILAPGDIISNAVLNADVEKEWSKAAEHAAILTGSRGTNKVENYYRERIIQWRNFPDQGLVTIVHLPFDYELGRFVAQAGTHFATVSVVEPDIHDMKQMVCTVGLFVTGSAFPAWASAHLAQMAHSISMMVRQTAVSFKSLDTLLEADQQFYMVLSLRTCPQGRPLLPCTSPDYMLGAEDSSVVLLDLPIGSPESLYPAWFRPMGEFNFPNFLQLFLVSIGCPEVQVFNTMDGALLVPYQAVVQRSQWEQVASRFDAAWKVHKTAYRKLNSSKHAPTISEGRSPRFAEVADDAMDNPQSVSLSSLISVHNTFIEVEDGELNDDDEPKWVRNKSA
ncbi:unnamed protein product [Symbiodinium natans]|uniref:Uncharacterized protein n=1 Tax=Symbiodinium natans TaxID=878477 RepID=A0A812N542_9DINO|nr:unnamed protein product [Symbiodinium natans]